MKNRWYKIYAKGIAAFTAAAGVLVFAVADGDVNQADVWQIVVAVLGALGVVKVTNAPKYQS